MHIHYTMHAHAMHAYTMHAYTMHGYKPIAVYTRYPCIVRSSTSRWL